MGERIEPDGLSAGSLKSNIGDNALLGMQKHLGQLLMSEHLLKYHACIKRNLLVFVSLQSIENDFLLLRARADMFDSGMSSPNLTAEQVVEDLYDILSRFKIELPDMNDKSV